MRWEGFRGSPSGTPPAASFRMIGSTPIRAEHSASVQIPTPIWTEPSTWMSPLSSKSRRRRNASSSISVFRAACASVSLLAMVSCDPILERPNSSQDTLMKTYVPWIGKVDSGEVEWRWRGAVGGAYGLAILRMPPERVCDAALSAGFRVTGRERGSDVRLRLRGLARITTSNLGLDSAERFEVCEFDTKEATSRMFIGAGSRGPSVMIVNERR